MNRLPVGFWPEPPSEKGVRKIAEVMLGRGEAETILAQAKKWQKEVCQRAVSKAAKVRYMKDMIGNRWIIGPTMILVYCGEIQDWIVVDGNHRCEALIDGSEGQPSLEIPILLLFQRLETLEEVEQLRLRCVDQNKPRGTADQVAMHGEIDGVGEATGFDRKMANALYNYVLDHAKWADARGRQRKRNARFTPNLHTKLNGQSIVSFFEKYADAVRTWRKIIPLTGSGQPKLEQSEKPFGKARQLIYPVLAYLSYEHDAEIRAAYPDKADLLERCREWVKTWTTGDATPDDSALRTCRKYLANVFAGTDANVSDDVKLAKLLHLRLEKATRDFLLRKKGAQSPSTKDVKEADHRLFPFPVRPID
jgi:hypothetical protein